jgi:membrane-associated PAP2 superfamily phosphatase
VATVVPGTRWLWRDVAVAVVTLLFLLTWDSCGVDLPLSRLFGSAEGFPWRNHWLLEKVLHDGAAWCARALFVVLGLNVAYPLPLIGAMPRILRLRWWLMSLLCALAVALLKHYSLVSCPWNLVEFGGTARHLPHSSMAAWWGAGDGASGRCFPAGHVSNAFAVVGGTLALREVSRTAARWWLAAVCAAGLALALTQLVRGAHFASHSLWTAWICWTLSITIWHAAEAAAQRSASLRAA